MKTAAYRLCLSALLLEKRAYAKLPWGYRFAQFYLRISEDTSDSFGRMAYALFAYYGVKNLPPVRGVPAVDLLERKAGERPEDYVARFLRKAPGDYGRAFGRKMQGLLLKKFRKEELAHDLLQDLAVVMLRDTSLRAILSGEQGSRSLAQVESLVAKSLLNRGVDILRRNDRYQDLARDEEGEELPIEDVGQWGQLESLINEQEMKKLLKEIRERIPANMRPDLDVYLDLVQDGVSDETIRSRRLLPFMREHTRAEDMKVDELMSLKPEELVYYFQDEQGNDIKNPAGVASNWSQYYKRPIKDALREHFAQ